VRGAPDALANRGAAVIMPASRGLVQALSILEVVIALKARERILLSAAGKRPDRVPVTAYGGLVPRGEQERALRQAGLGLVAIARAHQVEMEGVHVEHSQFERDGHTYHRQLFRTPAGEISSIGRLEPACGSLYKLEHFIKGPSDYDVLAYIWEHTRFRADYEDLIRERRTLGEDGVVMTSIDRVPFQKLMVEFAGVERIAIDLHERPGLLEELFALWARRQRELCDIAAASPAELVWVPDNITGEVVGAARFARYCAPRYAEYAGILSSAGKRMVVHMDGKLGRLKDAIASCEVHVVEAFTPPPDGDLSVAEARKLWPNTVLWLNFPSSVHLRSPDLVAAVTRSLLREAGDPKGFLIGITENVPAGVWARSFRAILEEVNRYC